jgi:hypothetical protein
LCKIEASVENIHFSILNIAELGREDYGSIPRNCDREKLKALDVRTDPQTRLNWW